jgi:hypothetical protein
MQILDIVRNSTPQCNGILRRSTTQNRFYLVVFSCMGLLSLALIIYPRANLSRIITHFNYRFNTQEEISSLTENQTRPLLTRSRLRMQYLSNMNMYGNLVKIASRDQFNNNKTLSYTCHDFCGGWGDRVRGLTFVFTLAILTQRRFLIDAPYPCLLSSFLHPNLIDWNYTQPKANRTRWHLHLIDTKADLGIEKMFKQHDLVSQWQLYDDVSIATNMVYTETLLQNPHFQDAALTKALTPEQRSHEFLFPLLFELLFKPSDELIQSTDRVLGIPHRQLTCLHLRIGKNPSNPIDFDISDRGDSKQAMIRLLQSKTNMTHSNGTLVYIASDSDIASRELQMRLPNNSVSIEGPILHIDRVAIKADGCRKDGQMYLGFLKVITEFYLFGECNVSILSESGFSKWGSLRKINGQETIFRFDRKTNQFQKTV